MDDLSWRIDINSLSKHGMETQGDATCLFELRTIDGLNADSSTVRFEMDRQEVVELLSQLSDIQRVFDEVRVCK